MSSSSPNHYSHDLDFSVLMKGVLKRWKWVVMMPLVAGGVALAYLSTVEPVYMAQTRILLENDQSVFRRPVDNAGEAVTVEQIDKGTIASQVEVLYSADLAAQVAEQLELVRNPEFNPVLNPMGTLKQFAVQLGLLPDPFKMSERERVLRSFRERLTVYPVGDSRTIAIEFESSDPELAAKIANALAEAYLQWRRNERLARTKSATDWLDKQIARLRRNVAEAEARVGAYRRKTGLYSSSNNIELSDQQLAELNNRLILAKAARTEAEARARLIRKLLENNGTIAAAADVLKSPLIQRLLEQRVTLQRRIAQLSATHLPSHPRMKRLRAELKGLQKQIRREARKIVASLENEAAIAGAREKSLSASLARLTKTSGGQSPEQIRLRELERDAKASREVLQTFLARQRDAKARLDLSAVSAGATIYERAYASTIPAFPKTMQIVVLTMLATLMVTLLVIVTKILMASMQPEQRHTHNDDQERGPATDQDHRLATLQSQGHGSAPPSQFEATAAQRKPETSTNRVEKKPPLAERPQTFAQPVETNGGVKLPDSP